MYMHPKTYLWLQEQDREAYIHQRALQRAAREGGEHRPDEQRGGINLAKAFRAAASAIANALPGSSRNASGLTGPTGA